MKQSKSFVREVGSSFDPEVVRCILQMYPLILEVDSVSKTNFLFHLQTNAYQFVYFHSWWFSPCFRIGAQYPIPFRLPPRHLLASSEKSMVKQPEKNHRLLRKSRDLAMKTVEILKVTRVSTCDLRAQDGGFSEVWASCVKGQKEPSGEIARRGLTAAPARYRRVMPLQKSQRPAELSSFRPGIASTISQCRLKTKIFGPQESRPSKTAILDGLLATNWLRMHH